MNVVRRKVPVRSEQFENLNVAFTQASDGEWNSGNTNELSAMLRRAYDGMIKEDVLEAAVQELRYSIEDSAQDLLESKATPEVLRKILGLPEGTVEEDEEEEEA